MKKNVFTKKIKSKTGASILLGLAFFLMCFFVASVIMASASVNASRAAAQKEEQRSFFAIQSTQNLIKEMLGEINGKNNMDNYTPVLLGNDIDEFGAQVPVYAYTRGGFHLREEEIKYDWCDEGTLRSYYGKLTGNINDDGNDMEYEASSFGLDCIGDEDAVFLKESIEEVAMLTMCKRLYDQGVRDLTGYGDLSTYFALMDRDFSLSDNPNYTYYFDIEPSSGSGVYGKNLPTVHVKMTADNKANLFFELTVDSRFASTYSATMKASADIKSYTPNNAFLGETSWKEICSQRSIPEQNINEYHLVTRMVNDTYITWYTDKVEVTKGIKIKKAE